MEKTYEQETEDLKVKLLEEYPDAMTTEEMQKQFEVRSFSYGFCFVTRKSDGVQGSLNFTHSPRIYYNFK